MSVLVLPVRRSVLLILPRPPATVRRACLAMRPAALAPLPAVVADT